MKKNNSVSALILSAAVVSLLGTSCSHKAVKPDEDRSSASVLSNDLGSSDDGNAFGLKTVHFGFDSNLLDKEAKSLLKEDAKILNGNPQVRIQIEGYCDNRGGIQYNIALGERRAQSVKHFLQDVGVAEARLTTISFGKEKPLDPADTEEAYVKNRRANLAVTRGLN